MTEQNVRLPNGKVVPFGRLRKSAESADGVKGVLLRSAVDRSWFFRHYREDGSFTDYELHTEELFVTVEVGRHAAFYKDGKNTYLDFSPALLAHEVLEE